MSSDQSGDATGGRSDVQAAFLGKTGDIFQRRTDHHSCWNPAGTLLERQLRISETSPFRTRSLDECAAQLVVTSARRRGFGRDERG